jgi:hypothetical protein
MADIEEIVAKFREAMQEGDFARIGALARENSTEDFSTEWPQSGERLSREASIRLESAYPEMSGTRPKLTFKRLLHQGDLAVVEGTIDYGDGIPVSYVGIAELRGDKIAKMTEYFANPFEPPAWREGITERMTPAPA